MTQTPVPDFIEMEARGRKFRVPKSYYDLDGKAQQRVLDAIERAEEDDDGASRFDRTSLAVLDQQSVQASRITALEHQVATLVEIAGGLQQQLDQRAEAVELQHSEALAEQAKDLAGLVTNAAAISSDLDAKSERHAATGALAEQQIQTAIAAAEQPLSELEGRLKAAAAVYGDGVIANQGKLAKQERRTQKLNVQLQELEGRLGLLS